MLRSKFYWLPWIGLIFGVVVGWIGIPVDVPNYSHYWIWVTPTAYRWASTFLFGMLGSLLGLCADWGVRREYVSILYGIFSLTLLFGIIGFYRYDASIKNNTWSLVQNGLFRADSATMPSNSQATEGTVLLTAATDMASASQLLHNYEQIDSLQRVSSALYQAGYYLVTSHNSTQIHDAEEYASQSHQIIEQTLKQNHDRFTQTAIQQILRKMIAITPSEFKQEWPAN